MKHELKRHTNKKQIYGALIAMIIIAFFFRISLSCLSVLKYCYYYFN